MLNKKFIISKNYDNINMILTNDKNMPVLIDSKISPDNAIITGGQAPHKPSSQGFVYIAKNDNYITTQYYPSVFGLKWVNFI